MKFINKVNKFMCGRYGIDELYNFTFRLTIILMIINLFSSLKILLIIEMVLILSLLYRSMSKNITKRKKENQEFLKIKNKILNLFKPKDKEHIYKKCPKCKTTLKLPLPLKRGIKHTTCPTCKKRLTLLVLRKKKIEIISKKKK